MGKHLGPLFNSDKGLPVTANADIVGPTGGFGWLLKLNNGAPHTIKLDLIEVSPDSPLMLSIAYPPGTGFTIIANAAWCSPSQKYSCKETFSAVSSIEKVRNSLGNTYHVDSNGLLTVRIIQTPQTFVGDPDWLLPDYSTPGKWGNWYALDRFSRNGVFLPRMAYGPWLEILADCPKSGAYCAEKPVNDMIIEVCPDGYNQVAYDKCCNSGSCVYADGSIEQVTSPTNSPVTLNPTNAPPTPKPTIAPTKPPTLNPTISPTTPPTLYPTKSPTMLPTSSPTVPPTSSPTVPPTSSPTVPPTPSPTVPPTLSPTVPPTSSPTLPSTLSPTIAPTLSPTITLTEAPTPPPVTMSPTKVCAKEGRQSNECGKKGTNFPAKCCAGLICNTNFKCVKEENYGCAGKNTGCKECGKKWKRAPPVCCPGLVCDFSRQACVLP